MLIPYFSLRDLAQAANNSMQRLPITEVCVGPGPNKALNVDSARMFLALSDYPNVQVSASPTPDRG